jgi:amino acid adenylation domain-containing protein
MNYWKTKLVNYENLNIITDRQRPPVNDFLGKIISKELNPSLIQLIKNLSKDIQVNTFSIFLSAYYLMLHVYSNQNDIIIGTTTANRHYNQKNDLIGFLVNMLCFKMKIDMKSSCVDFIKNVYSTLNEAMEHQDIQFENIVKELRVEYDTSRSPLFQASINYQNDREKNLKEVNNNIFNMENEELDKYFDLDELNSKRNTAVFDLNLNIKESNDSVRLKLLFATRIFEEETAKHFFDTYLIILEQLSNLNSNSSMMLCNIKWISKEETKILNDFNYVDFPQNKMIYEFFEEQVELNPNNIAFVFKDVKLTYKELNERSNILANHIKYKYKIKADDLIGLILERNEYMIICLLAVLKSGGAYVPMDPDFPTYRLKYILDETNLKLVLYNKMNEFKFKELFEPNQFNCEIVEDIQIESENIEVYSKNIKNKINSNNLAYVLFTSGSTGKPKGVLVEHKSFTNSLISIAKKVNFDKLEQKINVLCVNNYIFTVYHVDVFIAFFYGHSLHLSDEKQRKNISSIKEYIINNKIKYSFVPPSLLNQNDLLPLDFLVVGGDFIEKEIIKIYIENQTKAIVLYGTTETVVTACNVLYNSNANVIGKPLDNFKYYVCDTEMNLLPVNAIGELFVSGVGVTRGYLNKTDLTAERFIRNPFLTDDEKLKQYNSRIYKTGDLVRRLPNDDYELIGRNDFQVKIKGYRIEINEIEQHLANFTGVVKSIVTVKLNNFGNKYLVGYYTSNNELDEDEILEYLRKKLPTYMIPARIVYLKEIPLLPGGKKDLKALPDVEELINRKRVISKPRNDLEAKILKTWSKVLRIEEDKIDVNDDFYKLGGDSLLIVDLAVQLDNLGILDYSQNSLLAKYRTISQLSNILESKLKQQINDFTFYLKNAKAPLMNKSEYRMSIFQEEYLHYWKDQICKFFYKLSANVDLELLEISLIEIVKRNEILRTIIRKNGDKELVQKILDSQCFKVERVFSESYTKMQTEIEKFFLYDFANYLNVDSDEYEFPTRIKLFQFQDSKNNLSTSSAYMGILINHICFDGWSKKIFIKELNQYYDYYSKKISQVNFPKLEYQYKEFSLAQQNYIESIFESESKYWLKKFESYQNSNILNDKLNKTKESLLGKTLLFKIDKDLTEMLRDLSKDLQVSLFSIFLSAYYLMIHANSSQDDIGIAVVTANRNYSKVNESIGLYNDYFFLRHMVNTKLCLTDFIRTVFESFNEARSHHKLPYVKLLNELTPHGYDKDNSPYLQLQINFFNYEKNQENSNFTEVTDQLNEFLIIKRSVCDLYFLIYENKSSIDLEFEFETEVFMEKTANRYLQTIIEILEIFCKSNYNSSNNLQEIESQIKKKYCDDISNM